MKKIWWKINILLSLKCLSLAYNHILYKVLNQLAYMQPACLFKKRHLLSKFCKILRESSFGVRSTASKLKWFKMSNGQLSRFLSIIIGNYIKGLFDACGKCYENQYQIMSKTVYLSSKTLLNWKIWFKSVKLGLSVSQLFGSSMANFWVFWGDRFTYFMLIFIVISKLTQSSMGVS